MNKMRTYSFILTSFMFLLFNNFCVYGQIDQNHKLVGEWIGVDEKNDSAVIIFKKNTMLMNAHGQISSEQTYIVDYSKNPFQLDCIIVHGSKKRTLFSLVEFIDDNTIKWETFPGSKNRPTKFTNESKEINNTTIILQRIE